MTRHPAGHANYPGPGALDIVGELLGPTTYGTHVVAEHAAYDSTTDTTRVRFGVANADDLNRRTS